MRNEFNRSASGRGSGLRGSFHKAAGSKLPIAMQAKILRTSDQVRAKVEKHHAVHEQKWVSKRFTELLLKTPISRELTHPGAVNDPKARLMTKAKQHVASKKAGRLKQVETIKARMLGGSPIRANRKMNWGQGLGD